MTAAAALVAVAQVVVVALPYAEIQHVADARSHVEVPASPVHPVHDEASCATCQVMHGLGLLQQLPPLAMLVSWRAESHRNAWQPVASANRLRVNSRGPPV